MFSGRRRRSREERNGFVKADVVKKCSFTCICGIFLPLNPSTTTVYARSAFYPSLRFTLSLQSAFYTQSSFYPWSAVRSPQSAVLYTDRFLIAVNREQKNLFLVICEQK